MVTQITAYNSEGKIWNLLVKISEYTNIDGTKEKILDFGFPIQYNLLYSVGNNKRGVLTWDFDKEKELCIDMMGRNFGSKTSVYVKLSDIKQFLVQEGIM